MLQYMIIICLYLTKITKIQTCMLNGNVEGFCIPKNQVNDITFCQPYITQNICVPYFSVNSYFIREYGQKRQIEL
jgi:hypothetical protein